MHEKLSELLTAAGISDVSSSRTAPRNSNSEASGQDSASTRAVEEATRQIIQLQTAVQSTADSVTANTAALTQSTQSRSSGSALSSLGSTATEALGGGLLSGGILGGGLSLLFDGIKSLFGSGPAQPVTLTQYVAPSAQNFELASSNGVTGDAVYDSYSQPRETAPIHTPFAGIQPASSSPNAGNTGPAGQTTIGNTQHVTVQVQAMDSRSFLDHSNEIASAVREAMLNMHSMNDVINDL